MQEDRAFKQKQKEDAAKLKEMQAKASKKGAMGKEDHLFDVNQESEILRNLKIHFSFI